MTSSVHKTVFHQCGGMRIARWIHRKKTTVLMYHNFCSDHSVLEAQCRYLREHYQVISMSDVAQHLYSGRSLPDSCVAITVDDGHRNFYEFAFPVFSEYRIPVTVYLVTKPIDEHGWLWFDRVAYAFAQSPLEVAALPNVFPGRQLGLTSTVDNEERVVLGTQQHRSELADQYNERLKTLSPTLAHEVIDLLEYSLKVHVPEEPTREYAVLSWEEVRKMASSVGSDICFGAHTAAHPILSRVDSDANLREEILGSKKRIEAELDRPVLHFAYPNGQPPDITERVTNMVRETGYKTAVTTSCGQIRTGDDPFSLLRISCDAEMHEWQYRQRVAAFRVC